jgi:hypothetical protein
MIKMMLEIVTAIVWLALTFYITWFLFGAKTYQSLTLDDLALQWKLHKQKTGCTATRIRSMIKRNGKIVGFKCNCGYEFYQKRLITQRVNKQKLETKQCS